MFDNLSISLPKELLNLGTVTVENSNPATNESLPQLWQLNEAIQILETTLSSLGVLHMGGVGGAGIATILGIVASSGLMIRGMFVYYLACYSPRNRLVNKLMMLDQVRMNFHTKLLLFKRSWRARALLNIAKFWDFG